MCQYQVNTVRSIILLVVTFTCSTAFAAMYKWVDEEGNTHYTQQKPAAGIESKTIKPPRAVDSSEAEKTLEKQQEFVNKGKENRKKQAEAKQRAAEEKARQEKNCELSRARLKSLTLRPKVSEIQKDGSWVIMPEEKRQAEIAKSRESIKELCK